MHTGAEVSRYIEDPLVAFGCCLLYGRIVVALTHSPFPFLNFVIHIKSDRKKVFGNWK